MKLRDCTSPPIVMYCFTLGAQHDVLQCTNLVTYDVFRDRLLMGARAGVILLSCVVAFFGRMR